MQPEFVTEGVKVWVHAHHAEPIEAVLTGEIRYGGLGSCYFVTVRYPDADPKYNWYEEIGSVTIQGDCNDHAYHWWEGKKIPYLNQAPQAIPSLETIIS